ncbi:hypothetical protein Q7P35_009795 [Cladosporium inversicolor]
MANGLPSTAFAPGQNDERTLFCFNYKRVTSEKSRTDAIRHSPLVSLAVKDAINNNNKNPAPQPSTAAGVNTQAPTLFGATSSAGVPIGSPLFATPISQRLQSATGPAPLFSFGTSNLFGQNPKSPLLQSTGLRALSISVKLPPKMSTHPEGLVKVQKLDDKSSPSTGRLASNGAWGPVIAFGKENVKPSFSFLSQLSQAAASPASTSTFTAAPRTDLFPASNSSFSFFGAKNYREAPEQAPIFGKPEKAVSPAHPAKSDLILPQYGLLGFDLDNCDTTGNPEPILLNTNPPSSVFLCGFQGSGKSYTLSCMLENHLLYDPSVGVQRQTIPGFVFHWDTNTSGPLAEAASLCSRGIKVRLLVSWSNYQQMKSLHEDFARKVGGKIEVRPLLVEDTELTVNHIRNLMAFRDSSHDAPLYLEIIQNILRRLGRKNEKFSDNKNLQGQQLVNERKKQGLGMKGDCITVEKGTLTIVDLSDPFVDASTACVLFDICLGIILKRHKEAITANKISPGLTFTLDEAHKFLDKGTPSADIFTSSLLTTIREQRHNAARVIIATQEPTISEKLLDLCSVSIVHRFNSPAWFTAICGHLGGASNLTSEKDE